MASIYRTTDKQYNLTCRNSKPDICDNCRGKYYCHRYYDDRPITTWCDDYEPKRKCPEFYEYNSGK